MIGTIVKKIPPRTKTDGVVLRDKSSGTILRKKTLNAEPKLKGIVKNLLNLRKIKIFRGEDCIKQNSQKNLTINSFRFR